MGRRGGGAAWSRGGGLFHYSVGEVVLGLGGVGEAGFDLVA